MGLGTANVGIKEYRLAKDQTPTDRTKEEKDIGVIIDDKLSFDQQITEKVNKANSILGVISRSFEHLPIKIFRLLYTSLVRPHLGYANAVWNPYKKKHIDMIENVQRRATRLVPGLFILDNESRLESLSLPTLTYRCMRGDMIVVFKIITGKYFFEPSQLYSVKKVMDHCKQWTVKWLR